MASEAIGLKGDGNGLFRLGASVSGARVVWCVGVGWAVACCECVCVRMCLYVCPDVCTDVFVCVCMCVRMYCVRMCVRMR